MRIILNIIVFGLIGAGLTAAGYGLGNWEFWSIIIPLAIVYGWVSHHLKG